IGGLVTVYFGRTASFIVNAVSFLVSALLLLLIRTPFSERSTQNQPRQPFYPALREALKYARTQPRVLALLVCKGGCGLAAASVALLSVFGQRELPGGPKGARGIALLLVARGLGALAGPFALRALVRSNEQLNIAIAPCIALFGIGYLGLAQGLGLWFG